MGGDIQLNQKLYEQQFSLQNNFEKGVDIRKTLVIASTPRCGSHFLGHAASNRAIWLSVRVC